MDVDVTTSRDAEAPRSDRVPGDSSEAKKPSAGRFYRPELDVVRFMAFLLVFFHHSLPSTGDVRIDHLLGQHARAYYAFVGACRFGLTLFFTLSAFLICELLLREREAAGVVQVKQFYIRRILRIWPLYYLGLALGLIVALLPGGHVSEVATIGWFAIFMGAWHTSFYGLIRNPAAPLWSISVEEQFYLLAPWTVKYFSRGMLYAFCAVLTIVANGVLYFLGSVQATGIRVGADSFVQFECFAAGILLCLVLHGRVPKLVVWQRLALLAGCCACWMTSCYGLNSDYVPGSENPGSWALIVGYGLAALGSVLLLIAFLGIAPKALPGWSIYLGRISFGLYVYHEFAMYISYRLLDPMLGSLKIPSYPLQVGLTIGLNIGVPLGLTVLMAAISYRYFETPFLKMKQRHSVIKSEPISR